MSIRGPRCYEVRSFIDLWRIEIQIEMQTQYLMLLPSGARIVLKFFTAQPSLLCKSTKTSTSRCFILKASDQANFMSISSHRPLKNHLFQLLLSAFSGLFEPCSTSFERVFLHRELSSTIALRSFLDYIIDRNLSLIVADVCLLFVVIKSDSCAPLNIL